MTARQWINQLARLCSDIDAELPGTLLVRDSIGGLKSRSLPDKYIAYPILSGTGIYVEFNPKQNP
jgi:hypothetical protein